MDKKLIAMAVASAFVVPVAADAAPTMYGNLQAEIASVDNTGYGENNTKNSRTGIATGESGTQLTDNKRGRLGFKGSEDLGGGLKAIYKFEWQVDNAYGNVNDGGRESWVGMKGGFGEIKAGRIKSPYKYIGGVKYDPFTTTYLEARKSGGSLGGAWGQNSFWDTSISYKGKWGNLSAWAIYGLDSGDGTNNWIKDTTKTGASDAPGAKGDYALGVKYGTKKWEVFGLTESNPVADSSGNDWSANKVGGQMKFGMHTINAQYESISNSTGSNLDEEYIFVGYRLKMGKNILLVNYGTRDSDTNTNDTDYAAIGLIHRFSKKTRVFTGYRVSDKTDSTTANELKVLTAGLRIDF